MGEGRTRRTWFVRQEVTGIQLTPDTEVYEYLSVVERLYVSWVCGRGFGLMQSPKDPKNAIS
jgi:hypothetical protein